MKKKVISIMAAGILISTFAPTIKVSAEVVEQNQATSNLINERTDAKKKLLNLSDKELLTKMGKFNEEELNELSQEDVSDIAKQIRFDIRHPKGNYVGGTTVAKAVLKVWKKLPKGVKKLFLKRLAQLEHF